MANLATVTNISPQTSLTKGIGTSITTLVSAPANGFIVKKITSIIVANIDGTNDCDVSIFVNIFPVGTTAIASTVTVPADSSLVVLTKDNYIYLTYNDSESSLQAQASAAGDLDIVVTYEEITCSSF